VEVIGGSGGGFPGEGNFNSRTRVGRAPDGGGFVSLDDHVVAEKSRQGKPGGMKRSKEAGEMVFS
jgi:hypothetical protein